MPSCVVPTRAAGDELRRIARTAAPAPRIARRSPAASGHARRLRCGCCASGWRRRPSGSRRFDREVILARGAAEAAGRRLRAAVHGASGPGGRDAGALRRAAAPASHRRPLRGVPHRGARAAPTIAARCGCSPRPAFLADAFRRYEACLEARDVDDEHRLRERLIAEPAAAADAAGDRHGHRPHRRSGGAVAVGLRSARAAARAGAARRGGDRGPARRRLARARVRGRCPGSRSCACRDAGDERAVCLVPSADAWVFTSRDREEELAAFARRLKAERRAGRLDAEARVALVVRRPLPYLYLARDVLGRAGIPYDARDTLPLAAEPFAAALDLVLEWIASGFTRPTTIALLRSPHLRFADADGVSRRRAPPSPRSIARWPMRATWATPSGWPRWSRPGLRCPIAAATNTRAGPCRRPARPPPPPAEVAPLTHGAAGRRADGRRAGLRRAGTCGRSTPPIRSSSARRACARRCSAPAEALAGAHERFDPEATLDVAGAAADDPPLARRADLRAADRSTAACRSSTPPRRPTASSTRCRSSGLIDADWPERERRSIFYPAFLLQSLGWPEERKRLDGARAAFVDLLGLAARRFALSTFTLEDDAIVEPSAFVHEVRALAPPRQVVAERAPARVFPWEALILDPRGRRRAGRTGAHLGRAAASRGRPAPMPRSTARPGRGCCRGSR